MPVSPNVYIQLCSLHRGAKLEGVLVEVALQFGSL